MDRGVSLNAVHPRATGNALTQVRFSEPSLSSTGRGFLTLTLSQYVRGSRDGGGVRSAPGRTSLYRTHLMNEQKCVSDVAWGEVKLEPTY